MAKKSMKVKQARPQKYATREYNRCRICGRPHAYIRKYGICRVCFRELAHKGEIPGVKKAIAAFKLRAGIPIGCKVTLRADKMYDFAYKLFNVALPRVRDFRGVSTNSFDGRGNYSMGIKEQLIFPEIEYDKIDRLRGMDIIFVTTAETDEEAKELLTLLGMPFKA